MSEPRAYPETKSLLMQWGVNVRARRRLLGLSQDQLADISGIPQSTLSRVERAALEPSLDLKVRICIGLGAEPSEIFGWPTLREVAS